MKSLNFQAHSKNPSPPFGKEDPGILPSMLVTIAEGNCFKDLQDMPRVAANHTPPSHQDKDATGHFDRPLSIEETLDWLTSSTGKTLKHILRDVRDSDIPSTEKKVYKKVIKSLIRDKRFKDGVSDLNYKLNGQSSNSDLPRARQRRALDHTMFPPSPQTPGAKQFLENAELAQEILSREAIKRNIERMKLDLGLDYQGSTMYGVKAALGAAMETTESLEELMDRIEKLVGRATKPDLVDGSVKRIEQFLLALLTLSQQTTWTGITGVILSYVSTLCDRSLTKIIMEEVKKLIPNRSNEYEHQSGWLTKNWKTLSDGPFGAAIGKILSLLIAVGFLPTKASTNLGRGLFELFKVKKFSDDGSSLPGLMECVVTTVDYVVDKVWPAAVAGNFNLLLQGEKMLDLDDEYRNVVDCVDLYLSAHYDLLKKKHGLGDSGFEIIRMIDDSIKSHLEMKRDPETTPYQKTEIERRLQSLNKFSNGIQGVFKQSTIRVRPYTFLLRGGSGVNKTQMNGILIHAISLANGFPEGDEYHCHLNETDPYMSDFHPKHISITFDDVGNPRPEREEQNPLFKIIQFINNMHCTAMSAEAHLKGKKDINVKIASATTNTVDLHSSYFSCSPASIMSRFNIIVDVVLKPEAVNEKGKIKDSYIGAMNPDMWDISAFWVKTHRVSALKDTYTLQPYEEVKDLADLIEFIAVDSKKWFYKQDRLVEAAKAIHKEPHCEEHPLFTLPCLRCGASLPDTFVPSPLPGLVRLGYEEEAFKTVEDSLETSINEETFYDVSEPRMARRPRNLETISIDDTPNPLQNIFESDMIIQDCLALVTHEPVDLYSEILSKLREIKKQVEEVDPVYVAVGTAAAILGVCFLTSRFCKVLEDQASIEDVNAVAMPPEIVAKRDDTYKRIVRLKTQYPEASMTATQQQFVDKMDMSLMMVKIRVVLDEEGSVSNEVQRVASWPVGGGKWLLPHHVFNVSSPVKQYSLEFIFSNNLVHKRFTEIVELDDIQRVAGSDIACVRIVRGGCNYDFSKFLQETEKKLAVGTAIQILPKTNDMLDANILPSDGRIMARITGYRVVTVKSSTYYAVEYTTEVPTFKGLCGAPVVTVGDHPMIIGLHTAGTPNGNAGAAAILTKSDLEMSYQGIFLSEKAPCPTEQLGTSFTLSPHCKWKSPVHWIPEEADVSLEYHGQHDLSTTQFKSKVTPSILVDKLEEIGIVREHSGPLKAAETMARQNHLMNCSEQLPPPNPKFFKLATADLKSKLRTAIQSSPDFGDFVHPLSYSDALNGVPGVSGYDPLPPNTAPGFGRTGPKWKLCIQDAIDSKIGGGCPRLLTQKELPDGTWTEVCEYQFDDEKLDVKAKVEELFHHFTEKVRPNVILKCNLKDEALPLESVLKGKLRVFAGATMDFVIATRMLFSPLNVLMTHLPTLFESAVGVNAQGKDWDFIGNYIKRFGIDRVFGGDFSKYDQRMRSDFTIAAMEILKDVMRQSGYPPDLIDLVDGVACEICFPFYEVNGVIIQVDGSNPSGHPLTVILNGLVNCLLMRYCYYAMHYKAGETTLPLFHEVVALMTYGDDNVAGVSPTEKLFNHLSVSKELSLLGMKYTMPDKKAEPTKFIPFDKLDFLKRRFRVHETTGTMIGALDIKSIYKSLTTTMKTKDREQGEAEVMAGNIANALGELWAHGPEVFHEHKNKFECLKEVKDGVFNVATFWRDVTEEMCQKRYEETTCVYEDCLKRFHIPYEYQSFSRPERPVFIMPSCEETFVDEHNLWMAFHDVDSMPYRGLIMYIISQDEAPAFSECGDINESFACLYTWSEDEAFDFKPNPQQLSHFICQFSKRRRKRKRIAEEIEAASSALISRTVITRRRFSIVHNRESFQFKKPIEVFWRLAVKEKFAYLPAEIRDKVMEFAAPRYYLSRIWKDPNGNYYSYSLR